MCCDLSIREEGTWAGLFCSSISEDSYITSVSKVNEKKNLSEKPILIFMDKLINEQEISFSLLLPVRLIG